MKYPIVLVHGIAALDRTKLFDFWGRIPEVLRQKGLKVYLGNTDSWGDFETNAGLLKETIDSILKETKSSKVHIIAHSKGGLDARYLIWKHDYADKIASLITISTPHGGSELADLVLRQKSLHSMFARRSLKILGKAFLDTNPDPYKAFRDISTAHMTEFNERVRLPKDIFFKAYYSVMRNSFDDLMFFVGHWYLKKYIGRNDGVVSAVSAAWGPNAEELKGKKNGISHAEIIDIKKREISGVDIPSFYLAIVEEIERKAE